MLQNPSDPEATCRTKAGVEHMGYVANVEEAVGEHGTAIIDWQCGQNTESDSQFLRNSIENAPEQEEECVVVADGAYGGYRAASCAWIAQRRPPLSASLQPSIQAQQGLP